MKTRLKLYAVAIAFMALFVFDVGLVRLQSSATNGRIAFASDMDGEWEIYTVNADGSDLRQLTFNESFDGFPRWSPNGNQIAYVHESDIYIMNADGSNPVRIDNTSGGRNPVWSPDGTKLAFESTNTGLSDIVILNLADSTTLNLTNTPQVLDLSPVWSPDGTRIAFTSSGANPVPRPVDGDPRLDLYIMNNDGSSQFRAATGGRRFGSLNWTSIDYIIYSRPSTPDIISIYSFRLSDGTTTLLSDPSADAYAPSVSPDGEKIAFIQGMQLAIMAIDGSGVSVITNTNDRKSQIDWQPVFIVEPMDTPTPTFTPTATFTPTETPTNTPTPTPPPTETPSVTCVATVSASDTAAFFSAITAANANGVSPDTICLTQSTYSITAVGSTADGANGLPSITSNITIVGNGATFTRDAAAPVFRLFHVAASGSLTLENLTVSGGNASGAAPADDGGAIYNRGTLTLTDSTIMGNSASADGGGIYTRGTLTISGSSSIANNTAGDDGGGIYISDGTLTVTDGTIASNTASDQGGGIRSVGSNITLTNASLTGNSALNGSGGGIYTTSTTLTINGGQISGNSGNAGGGLYLTNSPSAAQLDSVQLINNMGVSGGGMYLSQDGQAAFTNVTVTGNQATSSAAGIWTGGTLTLTNTTVSNNGSISQPGSAGGIRAGGGTLTVLDSTFSGNLVNSSSGQGAGVYVGNEAVVTISGGEISGNNAYTGGGLFSTGNLSLGTTISGNAASNHGGGLYISNGTVAVNYSTFTGNTASNRGGAITSNATLQVDNSVFSTNTANDRGGAIYIGSGTGSSIHSSCIAGNVSPNSSGIYSSVSSFDAITNWWGAVNGPSGAGAGSGDAVNSNVNFNPFIITDCAAGAGAGGGAGLLSSQLFSSRAATPSVLAPVRQPGAPTLTDEVGWLAYGNWVLDTLTGYTNAPSWWVNTVPREQESILEMNAPLELGRSRRQRLTFWERGQIAASDLVVVEVLPEGAAEWVMVDSQTSAPVDWIERTVDLSVYRGQTIRLRIRVTAGGELDAGEVSLGLWVDDLSIENR